MKVMIRKTSAGELSAYIAKKDLEEPIVSIEKPQRGAGSSRWPMAGDWNSRP
jgi:nitrogen fixation protein NifT